MTCCHCQGVEQMFDDKMARRQLKHYRRKGPAKATRQFLKPLPPPGSGATPSSTSAVASEPSSTTS